MQLKFKFGLPVVVFSNEGNLSTYEENYVKLHNFEYFYLLLVDLVILDKIWKDSEREKIVKQNVFIKLRARLRFMKLGI